MLKKLLDSSSKILAFIVYIGGVMVTFKLLGGDLNANSAIKVYTISTVVSGLLVGNKTILQAVERWIDKNCGGKKDESGQN